MDIIDILFGDQEVVGTPDVARALGLSEPSAREWATELDVAKVGVSFAWVAADVERLVDELEALDDEDEDDDDDEDDEDDDEDDDDDN